MKLIPLTQGGFAKIDDKDFELVSKHKWRLLKRRSSDNTGYAVTSNSPHLIRMHRMLINAPDNLEVDHKNGDSLDNQRRNLRLATRSQNAANRKAVGFYKYGNKYRAYHNGKSLGYFLTREEAHKAYTEKAKETYGEFAWQEP